MKKIVFEIFLVLFAYIIVAIYGYYNGAEPNDRNSWIVSAIIVITIYLVLKLISRKKRKMKY